MHGIQYTSGGNRSRRSLLIGQSDRNYSNCKPTLPLSTNLGDLGRFSINKSAKIFHALLPFLAMFALVFALSQTGAAYTLTSTSGIWTSTDGGSNINGLNTNHVNWGDSTGYGQSGLIFNGVGSTSFTVGQQISLGTLTHENFPIRNAASGATLKITLKFTDPAISSIDLNYDLVIDETSNQDKCSDCSPKYTPCYSLPDHAPCSSASTPCPDKVSWSNQQPTQSFSIAGTCYTLYIDGFKDESGNVVNQFITQERCSNPATLYGHIGLSTTAVSTTTPTVCEGTSSVTFTATSASCDSATYKWYKNESTTALANGAKYSGATTSALVINNLVQSDSGTYKAVATCSAGCTAAGSATLTVNSNPVCTITAPVTVCAGVTGYKFSVPTAGTGATYTWTATSGSITAGSGTREITWTAGSAGTAKISVTVTTANGCTCSNSVTVTVGSLPSCVITAPTSICAGVTGYKFSVPSSTGATYAWTASSGTITAGSSTREITWTAGAEGSATISVTVTGSNGCVCTSSTVVTVKSQPSCVITAPTSICAGVTGYKFSVPSSTGATYAWTVSSGTITAGSSTREITWSAGAAGSATISVTVTNSNGCVCSNSTTVTVTSLPSCTITTPPKVCAGVSGYKFSVPTAGSGATYSWTASSGTITDGSGTREITWTAGTSGSATISVTVTNSAGCSCSNTATVTVNDLPSCTITTPAKVCAGVSGYKFSVPTAGSGATYSWTASSGTITDGSGTREITWTAGASGSATISVTVTNSAGCSCSNTATVTVNDLPSCVITTPPKVCAGVAGYKFSVPTAGSGATYSWTASSGTITDGSGTREITWTAGTSGSATISVTVTNSAGCSCSNTATVTVNDLPSCTITTPAKICAGVAGYKFSVPTAGSGATYSWTASSGTITDGSGTREITWTAGTSGSATISVTVTNSAGCSCSNAATVTVNDLPSCTITTPAKICAGVAGYKFSVPTAGSGATYSWTASSGTITDGSGTREITWTAGTSGSATISVTVTNSAGCSCSNAATVTVNDLPSCTITTPAKICAGVAGYKFSVPTAGSGATYSWTASSGTITDGSGTREITWTAGTSGSATISVTVTNSAGCSCSNTAMVTINDLPSCVITTPPKVCAGVSGYKFSVPTAGSGATYSWTASSGTITDGSGTREITWTAGASGSATISVTVTNSAGCSCSDTATVTVNALPSCTITTPPKVCAGVAGYKFSVPTAGSGATYSWTASSGTITDGSGTREITWTAGTSGSATISVTVTNSAGCSCSNTATVTVNDLPSCVMTTPSKVCAGVSGYKFSVPTAGSGATYSWTASSGTITDGSGTREITWTAGTSGSATISVTVTNSAGCSCSNTATVTVNALPSCMITASASVCEGSTSNKASVQSAGEGSVYTWTIAGGEITAGSGTREITWTAGASGIATIYVTVTNGNGCSCSNSVTVDVKALPKVVASSNSPVCEGGDIQLTGSPSGMKTYLWSGPNGFTSNEQNPKISGATLAAAGIYTLAVTSNEGCANTATTNVVVNAKPDCRITAPESVCSESADNAASVADAGTDAKYTWTITGGEITSGQGTNQITWTAGTGSTALIGVTVENADGCSCTDSATVTVKPKPDCRITAPESVCSESADNAASVADAGTDAKYTWTITGGEITSGQGTNQITWKAGTDSTALIGVTVENAYGCSCTDSSTVTVKPKPDCRITAPESVCSESTGNAASVADAGTDAKYTWTITGGEITSGQGTNQITWTAGTDSTALIGVTVENAYGCSCTDSATVTIKPKPDCRITAPESVCSESADNTASVADAGTDAKYTWTITGGEITSGQGTNQITWTAGTDSTALIGVTVENADGCSCTDSSTVTVKPKPDCHITAPESVCSESTDNTASVADAGTDAKYTWTITGGEITSGQGTNQITWTAGTDSTALIGVTVENADGCSCTDSSTVTVKPKPDCHITAPESVCSESTDNAASVASAGDGAKYTWTITGGKITAGQGTNQITWTAGTDSTALIGVTVENADGCSCTDSATVTVKPKPDCRITAPESVCSESTGNAASVADAGTDAKYTWTITGGEITSGQGTNQITWTAGTDSTALIGVTVENADGCSCTDSATVTVKPKPDCRITAPESVCSESTGNAASVADAGTDAKYAWTITGGEITSGQGTNQITWTAGTGSAALIGVTVENANGCSCTDSATVTVKPKPDCSITAPETVCSESADNTASVADAGTDAKYTWTITGGEITSGQGTNQITWTAGTGSTALIGVTVENADGCSCTDSATVTVKPKPDCRITAPESVCSESTGNAASVADAGTDAKYTWTITGGEITSGQGTNQITWTAGTDSTALIGVTVENAAGCSCTDSATVTVKPKPDCRITAPESVCSESTDNAASVADAGTDAKYTWTITGGEITSGQGTSQITWTAGETGSVLIGITVEQSNGCSCTDSATITINPLPDCTITSPDTVCPDETDNIASVTAEEGATYKWEILSGGVITSGEDQTTMHWTSASSGTAILQVTVTKLGCSAVCTKEVAIKYMPGCLHPGGQYEINGVKYSDLNNNGVRDPSEPGLEGWTINLERPQGTIIDTTTTGADGSYSFVSLFPVTYFVSEVLQVGWVQTAPQGGYAEVTLSDEVPIQTVDFGNRQKIVPALECVRENPDGSYTAKFTYDNPNGEITIPKGDNNKIEPDPISGSQPDTFSNGINSFMVVFDPSSPITWTLEGASAVATKDSPRCSIGPTPLVVEKTADKTAVLAGDVVTFTFSVTNTGEVNVDNVQLVDTLSPGFIYQSAQPEPNVIDGNRYTWNLGTLEPQQSVQVVLKAQVDPSLCPDNNAQTSEGVIANPNQLNVLSASSEPSNLPQIMEALGRNKTKLEVKLDSIRKHRDAFNKTLAAMSSTVKIIDGAKYTLNNYTYVLTGESLSDQFNSSGVLVATEFARPAKDDLMRTEYSATGEILSDFYSFKPTRESLKIEYNKPSSGYRTYTVRYLPTGDTLILVVDSYGNIISREYEKRPGLAIIEGPLTNCVQAYGMVAGTPIESNKACVEVIWSCQGPQPVRGITLTKAADREVATAGDVIKYTYTIKNTGSTSIVTLTLKDDKLGLVMVNELVNLDPGAEITRTAYYTVKPTDGPILKNTAIAVGYDPASIEVVSDPASAVVKIVGSCLTKTAYPKVVKPGDYVTYNITWTCPPSEGDYILDEYPSGVSFISASPSPDKDNNIWFIGGKASGTITVLVQVAQNIGNTSFDMGQGVTGTGFVNIHNDVRTNPVILTNKATWYRQNKPLYVAYADVNVGKPSTYAGLREHGSGDYASEDVIKYRNLNRSIEWNKSLKATYKPTTFSLPGNRDIDYRTKWIEKAKTKNYATGGSTNEEYTYADRINREAYTKLDENGSTTITDTSFQGVGHIGLLKKDASQNKTWNATDVFESQEDYVGNFQIRQKFDEYGKNAEYEKSVFGTGYVSADRNVGKAQRSYESGTGNYQSEERISTVVNYIAKDIKLEHAPTSYTYTPTVSVASDLKWSEGVWSKSPVTLISEKFSSVESLERDTKVRGLNEMQTEANVLGQADFRTVYRSPFDKSKKLNPAVHSKNNTDEVNIDERYTGEYSFKRLTRFTGVAKYNRPHITLSKEARVDLANNTFADYKIVIENNGDHTLSPVYILDTFPQGTDYVYSSLRPSELTDGYANWTLMSLGIGDRVVIDLRLNISEPSANIVNRVQAAGMYSDGWVTAGNFSVVQLDWLTCYPIDISATKAVWIDAKDPQVVWYRLDLHNRQNYNMVAFMMDQLPEGMTFLNSSLQPSENNSNQMTWTIMNLAPGETRSIVYRVRALSKGTFVNTAYIDAFAVDGPDSASAKVEARVDLTTGREPGPAVFDRWTLPACFGLNCTQQNFGNDWMACYTCGAGGESRVTVGTPTCLSCLNTGDDSLP